MPTAEELQKVQQCREIKNWCISPDVEKLPPKIIKTKVFLTTKKPKNNQVTVRIMKAGHSSGEIMAPVLKL